jgi:hypothetical protein
MSTLGAAQIVAAHALRESLRRRVFLVVVGLTLSFGALYAWGVDEVFEGLTPFDGNGILDAKALAGATLLGLSMFGTLFLGTVLAVFLALNAIRGDAERGLLQPVVVRPIGRPAYLLGRWMAAAAVSAVYVICCFLGAVVITGVVGGFWPDSILVPALDLAGAVVLIAGITLLGLDLPRHHRERHRGPHGLRRGPARRAARLHRGRAALGHARRRGERRVVAPAVRGPLPGRPALARGLLGDGDHRADRPARPARGARTTPDPRSSRGPWRTPWRSAAWPSCSSGAATSSARRDGRPAAAGRGPRPATIDGVAVPALATRAARRRARAAR